MDQMKAAAAARGVPLRVMDVTRPGEFRVVAHDAKDDTLLVQSAAAVRKTLGKKGRVAALRHEGRSVREVSCLWVTAPRDRAPGDHIAVGHVLRGSLVYWPGSQTVPELVEAVRDHRHGKYFYVDSLEAMRILDAGERV